MKMMTQAIDSRHFDQEARRIRSRASIVLKKWGLLPRFKRWRLTQDPSTGMIVLFGILNNRYIAMHTSIPFSNYFDPRLLRDLADELQVQVVSCNSDGLRYAFILSRGQIDMLPTHIEYPFIDGDKLLVRVVYRDEPVPQVIKPQIAPAGLIAADIVDDQTLIRRGVEAFLKVLDDIKLRDDAALLLSAQGLPDVVVIDEDEFNRRVAEMNVNRQRINHLRRLMGIDLKTGNLEVSKKMQQAMLYALVNGGKLRRYRGGFWAMENWRHGQLPWFGTSTVEALVSRGLMSYSEWRDGRKGRFPVAAVVSKPPNKPVQLTD
jgi:hypothetical protein